MNLIKEFFSIEEKRISTLLIAFIVLIAYSIYLTQTKGDVPPGILGIIQGVILGVVGTNLTNAVQNYAQFKNNIDSINNSQNNYGYYSQQQNSSNWSDRI